MTDAQPSALDALRTQIDNKIQALIVRVAGVSPRMRDPGLLRELRDIKTLVADLARQSPEDEWQPIATHDGSFHEVLVAFQEEPDGTWIRGEARFRGDDGWWWINNDPTQGWGERIYPTLWMPLPAPPNALEGGQIMSLWVCGTCGNAQGFSRTMRCTCGGTLSFATQQPPELTEALTVIEAALDVMDGVHVSDFMLSFPLVQRAAGLRDEVDYLRAALTTQQQENEKLARDRDTYARFVLTPATGETLERLRQCERELKAAQSHIEALEGELAGLTQRLHAYETGTLPLSNTDV